MKNESVIEFDESKIQWKEFTSKNGKKFEVGHLKTESDLDNKKSDLKLSKKADFGVSVLWHIKSDSKWEDTPTALRNVAAITQYKLYYTGGEYDYILYFINTEHYNYYFHDETGDAYQVNTYRNGEHWVRYSSEKPAIVYISGS